MFQIFRNTSFIHVSRFSGRKNSLHDKILFLHSEIPYQVTVYTGDEKGAGTDSELKMTVFGEEGKTEEILLEKEEER